MLESGMIARSTWADDDLSVLIDALAQRLGAVQRRAGLREQLHAAAIDDLVFRHHARPQRRTVLPELPRRCRSVVIGSHDFQFGFRHVSRPPNELRSFEVCEVGRRCPASCSKLSRLPPPPCLAVNCLSCSARLCRGCVRMLMTRRRLTLTFAL